MEFRSNEMDDWSSECSSCDSTGEDQMLTLGASRAAQLLLAKRLQASRGTPGEASFAFGSSKAGSPTLSAPGSAGGFFGSLPPSRMGEARRAERAQVEQQKQGVHDSPGGSSTKERSVSVGSSGGLVPIVPGSNGHTMAAPPSFALPSAVQMSAPSARRDTNMGSSLWSPLQASVSQQESVVISKSGDVTEGKKGSTQKPASTHHSCGGDGVATNTSIISLVGGGSPSIKPVVNVPPSSFSPRHGPQQDSGLISPSSEAGGGGGGGGSGLALTAEEIQELRDAEKKEQLAYDVYMVLKRGRKSQLDEWKRIHEASTATCVKLPKELIKPPKIQGPVGNALERSIGLMASLWAVYFGVRLKRCLKKKTMYERVVDHDNHVVNQREKKNKVLHHDRTDLQGHTYRSMNLHVSRQRTALGKSLQNAVKESMLRTRHAKLKGGASTATSRASTRTGGVRGDSRDAQTSSKTSGGGLGLSDDSEIFNMTLDKTGAQTILQEETKKAAAAAGSDDEFSSQEPTKNSPIPQLPDAMSPRSEVSMSFLSNSDNRVRQEPQQQRSQPKLSEYLFGPDDDDQDDISAEKPVSRGSKRSQKNKKFRKHATSKSPSMSLSRTVNGSTINSLPPNLPPSEQSLDTKKDNNIFVLNPFWKDDKYIPLEDRNLSLNRYTKQVANSKLYEFTRTKIPDSKFDPDSPIRGERERSVSPIQHSPGTTSNSPTTTQSPASFNVPRLPQIPSNARGGHRAAATARSGGTLRGNRSNASLQSGKVVGEKDHPLSAREFPSCGKVLESPMTSRSPSMASKPSGSRPPRELSSISETTGGGSGQSNPILVPSKQPAGAPSPAPPSREALLRTAVADVSSSTFHFGRWRRDQNTAAGNRAHNMIAQWRSEHKTNEVGDEDVNHLVDFEKKTRKMVDVEYRSEDSAIHTYEDFIMHKGLEHSRFIERSIEEEKRLIDAKRTMVFPWKREAMLHLTDSGKSYYHSLTAAQKAVGDRMEGHHLEQNMSYNQEWMRRLEERIRSHVNEPTKTALKVLEVFNVFFSNAAANKHQIVLLGRRQKAAKEREEQRHNATAPPGSTKRRPPTMASGSTTNATAATNIKNSDPSNRLGQSSSESTVGLESHAPVPLSPKPPASPAAQLPLIGRRAGSITPPRKLSVTLAQEASVPLLSQSEAGDSDVMSPTTDPIVAVMPNGSTKPATEFEGSPLDGGRSEAPPPPPPPQQPLQQQQESTAAFKWKRNVSVQQRQEYQQNPKQCIEDTDWSQFADMVDIYQYLVYNCFTSDEISDLNAQFLLLRMLPAFHDCTVDTLNTILTDRQSMLLVVNKDFTDEQEALHFKLPHEKKRHQNVKRIDAVRETNKNYEALLLPKAKKVFENKKDEVRRQREEERRKEEERRQQAKLHLMQNTAKTFKGAGKFNQQHRRSQNSLLNRLMSTNKIGLLKSGSGEQRLNGGSSASLMSPPLPQQQGSILVSNSKVTSITARSGSGAGGDASPRAPGTARSNLRKLVRLPSALAISTMSSGSGPASPVRRVVKKS